MDGAGPSSSGANADAAPTPKRVQPQRKRRGVNMGNEIDQTIIEAQTWKGEKPLLDPEQLIHLTTDSSYAETAVDLGHIVKNFKAEQYYTRPEVIELYRAQRNIATPSVVSLKDEPSLSRFRPREADKTIVLNAQSDEVYQKRHKALEAHERRTRLRELELLKQEHRKLKERMEKLAVMDYVAFMSLPAEDFPPLDPPVDLSDSFSEAFQQEGERRRQAMLEAARTLDERYQFLLREEPKPEKKTKAAQRPPTTPAPAPAVVDETMDVEVVEDAGREHASQEEVVTARPPAPTPKPKNKGGRPRVTHPVRANSAVPQFSNAVASGSGKKSRRASRPPVIASSVGKRRADSSAFAPSFHRTPSPRPPPRTAPSTRGVSVDMSETGRISMEVSDVRTPMPPTPAPPPVLALRHRVIETKEPPVTASPPPVIQPEQLPVVQGANEDDFDPRPRKKPRVSTRIAERQSSAPPESPSRTAPHWKTPPPTHRPAPVRRAPSLPPIASISSAELAAENDLEGVRESSPAPALEAMLQPSPEPLPELSPAVKILPEASLGPRPEGPPAQLPDLAPQVATLPQFIPESLQQPFSPAQRLATPGPSTKWGRSDNGNSTGDRASTEPANVRDIKKIRQPRPCEACAKVMAMCKRSTPNKPCKRCVDKALRCSLVQNNEPVPAPLLATSPAPVPVPVPAPSPSPSPSPAASLAPAQDLVRPAPQSQAEIPEPQTQPAIPEPHIQPDIAELRSQLEVPEFHSQRETPELHSEPGVPELRSQRHVPEPPRQFDVLETPRQSEAPEPRSPSEVRGPRSQTEAPKPQSQSEAAPAPATPSMRIMTPGPSIQPSTPSVKRRSLSPEVPVVTANRRGRGSRGRGSRGGPKNRGPRPKEEPLIVQAAHRTTGSRRKAQRHTDAFGAKLPEILKSIDEYDYELPEDILKDVPRMTDLAPDGSPSADKAAESVERLKSVPDLLPLSYVHGSDVSRLTTRNTTPIVRTVAKAPESDDDL